MITKAKPRYLCDVIDGFQILERTVLRVSKCLRQWHTDRLQVTRGLQLISRILEVNCRHKLSLIQVQSARASYKHQPMRWL